jgi:hypothetical protein
MSKKQADRFDDALAEAPASFDPVARWRPAHHRRFGKRLTSAAVAVVAVSAGALAIGVLAIGSIAIGRLMIGRVRVKDLEIDNLVVHKVKGLG